MYNRDLLPYFAGIPTFMRARMGEFSEVKEGTIAVVGAPTDFTCSTRPGARFGPRAIRESSLYFAYQLGSATSKELVDVSTGQRFIQSGNLDVVDLGDLNIYPTDVMRTTQSISDGIKTIAAAGGFPILLGGDHYVAYPSFKGFAEAMAARGKKRIGYIHLDGSLDISDENRVWGKYFHGTNSYRISELESVNPRNMAMVGIKGLVRKETWDYVESKGINVYTNRDIRSRGIENVMRDAVAAATKDTDAVYLSIDIDVMDGAYAPGTGGITIGGITSAEFMTAMDILAKTNIGAMDLVEVAPNYDPGEATQRLAATAIFKMIAPRVLRPK